MKPKEIGLINITCKECKKGFINNGRNARTTKDYCSDFCIAKAANRNYKIRKKTELLLASAIR